MAYSLTKIVIDATILFCLKEFKSFLPNQKARCAQNRKESIIIISDLIEFLAF